MCWHYTGQFASTDKDFWGVLFGGKKNLIDVTLFLKNIVYWITAYHCKNSSKNSPEKKNIFLHLKRKWSKKVWKTGIKWKEYTLPKKTFLCSKHLAEAWFWYKIGITGTSILNVMSRHYLMARHYSKLIYHKEKPKAVLKMW